MPVTARKSIASLAQPVFWAGALLSSAVGVLFYVATTKSIEKDADQRFANISRNAANTISARVKSYTDLLRAAGSLFQSSEVLTHAQFHEFVDGLSLARNFPAVDTLNFTEEVLDQQREAFEQRLQAQLRTYTGLPVAFGIKPPGRRPAYSVVTYIEPAPPKAPYGVDILSNPYVAATIAATRDRGTLMASGTPIAAMSGPNRVFLGMRMPIYRHGIVVQTVEERRAAYVGSVGIAFSVPRLVKGVLDEMPIRNVRMTLSDSGPRLDVNGHDVSARERTLYDSQGTEKDPIPARTAGADFFVTVLPIDFNGRPWRATFSTRKSAMYTNFDEYFPRLAMSAGFLGAALVFALFYTMSSSRRRAIKMAGEMTQELRQSQTKLQASHQNLRRLAAHADNIKEGERKRIAREIHDDLGQNLLALRIDVDMLASRTRNSQTRLHARATGTLTQIDATIKSVRQIINDLRPNVLDLGLSAAVDWQVSEFTRRTGIPCHLRDEHSEIALNDHCATAFFRILQESLSNISRHAKATEAAVELTLIDRWLSMSVRDNGVGFPASGRNKIGSFGLVGIEERIHILGGLCSIFATPGGGTTVWVSVPTDAPAAPDVDATGTPAASTVSALHPAHFS
jgi:signal transduction histidine kinase/CHASE1-domain containing sensor protein